jgi:HSP20 family protein
MSQLVKKTSLFPSFPSLFDDFFTKDFFDWNDKNFARLGSTLPSVNLKETDQHYLIELAAPGMKKEDFKVEMHNGILTVSAERKEEKEEKKEDFLRREFSYSSFSRSFAVPENSLEDKVEASYKDGILKITLNKKEAKPVKVSKAIEVK